MFCPYCGNPCAENHKFCFRCGKPLPEPTVDESIPESPESAEPVSEAVNTEPLLPETEAALSELPEPEQEILPTEEPTSAAPMPFQEPAAPTEPAPQPKKGRLWPPILALCIMMCVGLAAFFLAPRAPEPARSCFTVESGVLYFDYSLYTGSDELTVPDSVDGMAVTGISQGCFADCDRLTTIILPETVTIIGDKAFSGCDNLRGIYIPEGVLSIGADALAGCPSLEAVSFPASTAEIGDGCLDQCDSLKFIFYDGTYAQWRELYDGTFQTGVKLYTKDGTYTAQP